MKLKSLKINSHYHLKDLEFDFTYPAGHKKAGKPLDKICFIGQSATGKSKILNLIFNELGFLLFIKLEENSPFFSAVGHKSSLDGDILLDYEYKDILLNKEYLKFKNLKYHFSEENEETESLEYLIDNSDHKALFFNANYISEDNLKHFNTNPLELVPNELKKAEESETTVHYHFKENSSDKYILKLLESFLDFRRKYDKKVRELLLNGYIADLEKFNKEFKEFQIVNPNPIDDFSKKFDSLLSKLHLEIDRVNVDYPIPFKNKTTNEIIPIDGLSTGTKALLLYMLPLYQIDTSKSIILIDEPERSLYPDVQMEMINFFREISPDSQIITATHSPFIAASFEPEERFILYFDDNGNVKVKSGVSPIGDDPNDILKNDFNIDYINDSGKIAFEKYLELKKKISAEKNQVKKEELISKYEELGDKYNF